MVLFAPEKEIEKVALRVLKEYNYQVLGVGRSPEEMEALLVRLKERGETVDRIVVQTVDYPEADQALNKLSKLNNQYVGSGMICNITSSLKKIEAGLRNALEPD